MTNFDFLKQNESFDIFADVAITAEKLYCVDPSASVLSCRKAMELAVRWMYSVDGDLVTPWKDQLSSLISTREFRGIVDQDIIERMHLVRKLGNIAAHSERRINQKQAEVCLENLFYFMDCVAYLYAEKYEEQEFRKELLESHNQDKKVEEARKEAEASLEEANVSLKELEAQNQALVEELTALRAQQQQTFVPKPLDLSEYETRKIYIDAMLMDAGWTEGKDWINEVELPGMPNKSEVGYADYVLYGDDGTALAVVEAKRTCVDVSKGRQQANLYANLLEKRHGRRPAIFLTNGFETRFIDGQYSERKVASIYSKRDLEKMFNLRTMRTSLNGIYVNPDIAGRYYQREAINRVCETFEKENKRRALLVMATGSGKTRTVMGLCDVLLNHGWVKNILFLADRTSLVTQAKRAFVNLMPNLSLTNLCEEKDNYDARCVFSTYQTMIGLVDEVKDEQGKLYTVGHFDLIICDEAHRSIYNKYQEIFNYFDAPLVGLTATPKDEIDKNTYEIFQAEKAGIPTYGYELAQAVKDGFLVDYKSVETKLKFLEDGIVYDELSDEDKAAYEETFADDGEMPEAIDSGALNRWLFNKDTIREVLNLLMTKGIRIEYGEKIGKTIIFARNHRHAEEIVKVFNEEYPSMPGYAQVIDNHINYAQTLIDQFSDSKKLPQIAVSVDMLDTGIDVPEAVNLVFFKKVMSKAKFWQMIGRGTRLCPGLIDGEDKSVFYIFDVCGNFEFFRVNAGAVSPNQRTLQERLFGLKAEIVYELQNVQYQTEELIAFRTSLIDELVAKVKELNRENFVIRQHLRVVDMYSNPENYKVLTAQSLVDIKKELAPLILPDEDNFKAMAFDALLYQLEACHLSGGPSGKTRANVLKRVRAVSRVGSIPEVKAKKDLIQAVLGQDYLESLDTLGFEHVRKELRDLMKYVEAAPLPPVHTNFEDEILDISWNDSELEQDDLKPYHEKAAAYVREHPDHLVIHKLHTNKPLTHGDLETLERVLWDEIGTEDDYHQAYGDKPLGEFVREIVGMDMNSAKEAFAEFLNGSMLDANQIYFVNQIVEYIVQNGMLKDFTVLQQSPFNDRGSVIDLFPDTSVWMGIRKAIEQVNSNAIA